MIATKQLQLDDNLLDVILNFIKQHPLIPGSLRLLQTILNLKLQSHLIYDLMLQIHEKLNNLRSESATNEFSQCLTTFLLKYALSDKALRLHFERLIGSLQHPFVCG